MNGNISEDSDNYENDNSESFSIKNLEESFQQVIPSEEEDSGFVIK